MPSTEELLVFVIAILALWIVLKVAKLAIKVILFLIAVAILGGVLWFVFMR